MFDADDPLSVCVVDVAGEFAGAERAVVVPMTSNVSKVFDFQLLVDKTEGNGLATASKAQCEQIRSVSITRFQRQLGTLSQGLTLALNDRLRLHLGV